MPGAGPMQPTQNSSLRTRQRNTEPSRTPGTNRMPNFPAHRGPQSRLRPKCTLAPPIRTIEEIEQRPIEALFGAALALPEIEMRSEMKQDGGLKLKCRLRVTTDGRGFRDTRPVCP